MGVYIKGMQIPEKQTTLTIFPNGYVAIYDAKDSFIGETKAFPVPDHGRLGDLDALFKEVEYGRDHHTHTDGFAALHHRTEYNHFLRVISCAPTIIPADRKEV